MKGIPRALATNRVGCALGKPGDYPTAAAGVAAAGPETGAAGVPGVNRAEGRGTAARPGGEPTGPRIDR
ncbi:hypothetical protein E2P84_08185 [Burkholderia cepacia]|nr:hypothetical protein E2P84_08185 [Burkholderia cepacia]